MPSPFPGMDPFLESPEYWRDLHQRFITYSAEALNDLLPLSYFAKVEERLIIQPFKTNIYPDVTVFMQPKSPLAFVGGSGSASAGGQGGAVVREADPYQSVQVFREERVETYIEIVSVSDRNRVVTTIELLSPTNKTPGPDQNAYLAKQQVLLESPTHLIEIDLLRGGAHTIALPYDALLAGTEEKMWDYVVSLHRSKQTGGRFDFWVVDLPNCLPRIWVPLEAEDPDIVLDLQSVLNRTYDAAGYSRFVDYRCDPVPPLEGTKAEWADTLLREKKIRIE